MTCNFVVLAVPTSDEPSYLLTDQSPKTTPPYHNDKLPHMHNVTLREAQTIFFDHIRTVIFEEHELRSLQSLLRDYSSIISRFGFPTSRVKSSYIKDILTREFEDKIGFHSRPQRNQSDLV
ncbi:hypothetical protein SKAU_G00342060 [Synaphobranchus kaupii]|uniref:Uncharacterized protein n=1 Tax=Synaphobranchus kaupii TaxID=118154 RepID=A0A9Q1EN62_SYNKA|nr:hypothetical protein SKAU_G00342060 [Synaphobranchus kaupii]